MWKVGYLRGGDMVFAQLASLLLPKVCLLCDAFCEELVCGCCLASIKSEILSHEFEEFGSVVTLFPYKEHVRKLLHYLKFLHYSRLEAIFFCLLSDLDWDFTLVDWVVPVPSSPNRFRLRGFNPVDCVFRKWVLSQGGVYDEGLVFRHTDSRPLFSLDRLNRLRVLSDAFSVSQLELLQSSHVMIVDDILTSGSTIQSISKVLYSVGVSQVSALCFAKS